MKTDLSETWSGVGTEVSQIIGLTNPICIVKVKLVLTLTKVVCDVYNVVAKYYVAEDINYYGEILKAGSLYHETEYLVKSNGENKFIAEDDSGNGIQFFDFKRDTLNFGYNINGTEPDTVSPPVGSTQSFAGQYVLKKVCGC
jgi:hypothetical protein